MRRLETAIGYGSPLFTSSEGASDSRDTPAVAEAVSALRLRYEEIVVRLYICQNRVHTVLRDPACGTKGTWKGIKEALGDAMESMRTKGDEDLWWRAESLIRGDEVTQDSRDIDTPDPDHPTGVLTTRQTSHLLSEMLKAESFLRVC